jgi:hypothetical protein
MGYTYALQGIQPTRGVRMDRFVTIAGMTVSAIWLVVLAVVTAVQRWS